VLVTGPNGAGKTNLLEALHVGAQGFSPRTRADRQLVRWGATSSRIALAGERAGVATTVELSIAPAEGRRARLNGTTLRSAEALRSELSALVFTPDRLAVVKGGPAARRAYFDRSLGRLFPARAGLPVEYGSAVAQRNAALRRVAAGLSEREALTPWTERVSALGSELVAARLELLELLGEHFAARAGELGLDRASLAYEGEPPSLSHLEARVARDLERGATGIGPHLDDVSVRAGERELRSFGSQGEQRLAMLALLLAEAELVTARRGVAPLLLLDDVLSELDGDRRHSLGERIARDGQTLVTATGADALPLEPAQLLAVRPGHVERAA
jgi:DNA replication and repair protein RecF